jgi:hypothetical protein
MEVLNVQEDLGLNNSVKNFVEGVATAVFGKIRIQTKKKSVCDRRGNVYDARNVILYLSTQNLTVCGSLG